MFSNVKTSDQMDADGRNAVTETGSKRAEVTPATRVEPGISVRTGISTFYGNLLPFMFGGRDEFPNIVTTHVAVCIYYEITINCKQHQASGMKLHMYAPFACFGTYLSGIPCLLNILTCIRMTCYSTVSCTFVYSVHSFWNSGNKNFVFRHCIAQRESRIDRGNVAKGNGSPSLFGRLIDETSARSVV
jgi:hypothetical protein